MIGDDDAFVALRPVMEDITQGFSRVAILVQTAIGKLQATRRSREGTFVGTNAPQVFADEEEAIAFVSGRGK